MNTGTYQIVCKTTGRKYIGSTWGKGGFTVRWRRHLNLLRKGTHSSIQLQRSWNKYSEDDFLFLILDILETKEECLKWEQMYFDTVPRDTLLNGKFFATGGINGKNNKGKKHSEETKAKMRESHKLSGTTGRRKGFKLSDEEKKKRSETMKGRAFSDEHRKNISSARLRYLQNKELHNANAR